MKIHYILNNSEGTLETQGDEVLFDELSYQGIIWPHGCLAGSCGACRTEIIQGDENLSPPSPVEEDTINKIMSDLPAYLKGKKIRLACRAKLTQGEVKITPLPSETLIIP